MILLSATLGNESKMLSFHSLSSTDRWVIRYTPAMAKRASVDIGPRKSRSHKTAKRLAIKRDMRAQQKSDDRPMNYWLAKSEGDC